MKQEQTIDDILKLLKDSINDENTATPQTSDSMEEPDSKETNESFLDELLKECLQKQYVGEATEAAKSTDAYILDDDFLQEAVMNTEVQEEEGIEEKIDEAEELEDPEEFHESEESEELEDAAMTLEEPKEELPLAIDYDDVEEEIEYELLPKVGEEEETSVILRTQSTDAVPVGQQWEILVEEEQNANLLEGKEEDPLLSGSTYTIPKLSAPFDEDDASAYDLMRQLGCENEWQGTKLPLEDLEEEESDAEEIEEEPIAASQKEDISAEYQKKKRYALLRIFGGALISAILFLYELLPLFGVRFGGVLNYQEYLGSYLLIGFQLLLISALLFGKRMGKGILRIFSLRPNIYSVAALAVIAVLAYDLIAIFTMQELVKTFHFLVSLFLLLLSFCEYLLLAREIKILSIVSEASDRQKYTLNYLRREDRLVAKMVRGGLSDHAKVAIPERSDVFETFFKESRERIFGVPMASKILIPSLLLSILAAIVTIFLNYSITITMVSAMSMLFATIPITAMLVACFPLWFSTHRLAKRQIALSGYRAMDELSDTDVLIFEDLHLFRKCTTSDTGIAFYEKKQTTTILGCLECLYSKLGGPLFDAFSNVPKQYRFQSILIRRLTKGGVEALIDRKHTFLVGDAAFMQRYGLNFPHTEEKAGRTTVYISLDGKISAKMSVRYQPEPIFEMLVERMHQEGIQCVIKTFDPMISAARISSLRTMGDSPISVIHQGLFDLKQSSETSVERQPAKRILAVASRFKLIEALSWARSLVRLRRIHQRMIATFSVIGVAAIGVLIGFGKMHWVNQYWLILWSALCSLVAILLTTASVPSEERFSVNVYRAEWEKEQRRKHKKQKRTQKGKK